MGIMQHYNEKQDDIQNSLRFYCIKKIIFDRAQIQI